MNSLFSEAGTARNSDVHHFRVWGKTKRFSQRKFLCSKGLKIVVPDMSEERIMGQPGLQKYLT